MKFKVGDTVWWAKCRWEQIEVLCPACFGKREVTLILGNGDSVILPCEGCSAGFNPPSGYISEYDYVSEPEQTTITGIEIKINGDKQEVTYRGSYFSYHEEDLFENRDDALAKSERKRQELEEEQRNKAEHIKHNVRKNFSWNASYHLREAKRMRKQAEYHDSMAVLCKARAKDQEAPHDN